MKQLGAEVIAVSVDSPEQSRMVVDKEKLKFSLLSDAELKMIDAYGVRHEGASITGDDIARPAAFIVDEDGKIAWRMITDSYRIRVRPETVMEELQKMESGAEN